MKARNKILNLLIISLIYMTNINALGNEDNQKFAADITKQAKEIIISGIKKKYIELQRMLGKIDNESSDQEIAENILAPSPILRVFVSTSMNNSLLKRYIDDAKKYNAVLIFNGLPNGSWKDLQELVVDLVGENEEVAIQIDDEAFKRYEVTSVPSFVLSKDDRDSWQNFGEQDSLKVAKTSFDKIEGNIGIRGALRLIADQGDLTNEANILLEQGKGTK